MSNNNQILTPGQEVYIEYKKGIYLKTDSDGLHKIKYQDKDSEVIKTVPYLPRVLTINPPEWINQKDRNGNMKFTGDTTCWLRENQLVFYFSYRTARTFKEIEYISEKDLFDKNKVTILTEPPDYWNEEKIDEELSLIDEEIYPLNKELRKIQDQINKIAALKNDVYNKCFHKWQKGEEEETGQNFLGRGKQRLNTCKFCGKEEMEYYTSLS